MLFPSSTGSVGFGWFGTIWASSVRLHNLRAHGLLMVTTKEQAAELAFSAFQRVIWATDTALRVTKRVIVDCDSFLLTPQFFP